DDRRREFLQRLGGTYSRDETQLRDLADRNLRAKDDRRIKIHRRRRMPSASHSAAACALRIRNNHSSVGRALGAKISRDVLGRFGYLEEVDLPSNLARLTALDGAVRMFRHRYDPQ